jgi:hypothetical protein
MQAETISPRYIQLLAEKAEKLRDLEKRKPGQKGYRRSLHAFLDADAKAQELLLEHIATVAAAARGA